MTQNKSSSQERLYEVLKSVLGVHVDIYTSFKISINNYLSLSASLPLSQTQTRCYCHTRYDISAYMTSVYMQHNNDNKDPHYRSDIFHCLSLSLSASISSYKSLTHTHMHSLSNFHKTNLLQCHKNWLFVRCIVI